MAARHALLAGKVGFRELADTLDLGFSKLRLVYFTRWITPRKLSRRYDTRFFLALAPEGQQTELTDEHTGHQWTTPAAALVQFHEGQLPMLRSVAKQIRKCAFLRRAGGGPPRRNFP